MEDSPYATFYDGRKLARAPNGDLYIAWNHLRIGNSTIYVNKSTDNGNTWTSIGSPHPDIDCDNDKETIIETELKSIKKDKIRYFISFHYTSQNKKLGFGSTVIDTINRIDSLEKIQEIEHIIKKKEEFTNCKVVNFIKL